MICLFYPLSIQIRFKDPKVADLQFKQQYRHSYRACGNKN